MLLLLLAGIASLVTRQVVRPVRQAAEIAERFADGHLDERMPVHGNDEVARLAESYNEMAGSIQTQIRQLEEFGALQRRFTSDVSHELRTPLTTVRMAADVLHASKDQLLPALRRSSELLVTELDRFEALLADLLEISRLDAGVADLTRGPGRHARRGHPRGRGRAGVRRRVPARRCGCTCPSGSTPRSTRAGSSGSCATSWRTPWTTARAARSTSRWPATTHAVAVVVRDHGVGLRPGEAALVFNRFWRAEESRARRSGGSGLGLSISIEDARLHGGWLQAWGEPGRGSAFRLTLPRTVGEPLDGQPAAARAGRPRGERGLRRRAGAAVVDLGRRGRLGAHAGARHPRGPRQRVRGPAVVSRRRQVLPLVLLLVLAGLAGCASVPESSPVQVLRRVGDGDAPVLPPGPGRRQQCAGPGPRLRLRLRQQPGPARRRPALPRPRGRGVGRRHRRHRARRSSSTPSTPRPSIPRRTCARCASAARRWAGSPRVAGSRRPSRRSRST